MSHRLPALLLAPALTMSASALAHHPLGGNVPETWFNGLLSGLGHPVIGPDHLAFILLLGVLGAFAALRPLLSPAAFIAGTLAGAGLTLVMPELAWVEWLVAASLIPAGALLFTGRAVHAVPMALYAGLAGVFHGYAYGEAVVGAEPTPLVAYLIGFVGVQGALVAGAWWLTRRVASRGEGPASRFRRLAGVLVTVTGVAALV